MKVYRMTDGYSCGPRSLQTAFSHYSFYPSYDDVFGICETDINTGTEVDNLERASEYFGFNQDVYEDEATPELIKQYTDDCCPVIVMWFAGGDNHVSVAYKVDEKFVYLIDPSLHLYTEPTILIRRKMLERCWKAHPSSKWIMAILPPD